MSDWTIRATIGGTVYTSNRADAPGEAPLPALFGVQWRHELDDDAGGWPRRMAVTSGSVQLVMADATEAAGFSPEQTVFLEFVTGGQTVDSFTGRASFPVIVPHELGVMVTLQVSPWVVDLAADEVGGSVYPQESHAARLNRLMADWGWAWAAAGFPMTFASRARNATDRLSLLQETIATGAADISPLHLPNSRYQLYELHTDTDAAGQLVGFDLLPMADLAASHLPLRLREAPDLPGIWELYADPADPDTAPWVIDGSCVRMDATWVRRTDRDANTVHVQLDDDSVVTVTTAEPGELVTAFTLETTLVSSTDATRLGEAYLPRPFGDIGVASDGWAAEAFTVLLDETADGWYPPPELDSGGVPVSPLRGVMALSDVQRRHHPDGAVYMAGVVTALELNASGGTAELTVRLEGHPNSYPTAASDPLPLLIDDVAASIDSLHDSVTFNAAELARHP